MQMACLRASSGTHQSCAGSQNRRIFNEFAAPFPRSITYNAQGFPQARCSDLLTAMIFFGTLNTCLKKPHTGAILIVFLVLAGTVSASASRYPQLHELTLDELLRIRVIDFFQQPSLLVELSLDELLTIQAVRSTRCQADTDGFSGTRKWRTPR
jgi:hypothetical protein